MSDQKSPRIDRSVNKNLDPVYDKWEWQFEGACRNVDPESFFLEYNERGLSKRKKEIAAVAICNTCPVIAQCREHALRVPEMYGVWGGLTEEQRYMILKRRPVKIEHI
jgi:WhiB family redox-sensing transcriptional regulator